MKEENKLALLILIPCLILMMLAVIFGFMFVKYSRSENSKLTEEEYCTSDETWTKPDFKNSSMRRLPVKCIKYFNN